MIPASVVLQRQIAQLRAAPRQIADGLFRSWAQSFDLLWIPNGGVTPTDRIATLGTDAAELFEANAALVQMMLTVIGDKDPEMTAAIQQRVATIPAFTAHEDGTVTLD